MGWGGTGASELKKMHENPKIFMVFGVGVASASGILKNALKSEDFHGFGLWGGGRGWLQNNGNCIEF